MPPKATKKQKQGSGAAGGGPDCAARLARSEAEVSSLGRLLDVKAHEVSARLPPRLALLPRVALRGLLGGLPLARLESSVPALVPREHSHSMPLGRAQAAVRVL
jgi:hypothetical protein